MDPCSRQKLEILGYPPVEGESQFRSGGVDEACGVARAIKAFLVECRGGRLGVAQIAGRHGEPLDANFQPVADRREFHDIAGEGQADRAGGFERSEEHTSELQSLMRISYAVFCLKKQNKTARNTKNITCTD